MSTAKTDTPEVEPVDVLAVGAHPDDVEIGCGGTVARLAEQGYRVGIIDLTDGEPTPGSADPQVRIQEARRAAEILGAAVRITLPLPNRRLFDCFEARVALAKQIRKYRPKLVLALAGETPLASPDHYQARVITDAAAFYAKLTKWDEHFDHLPPHTVPRVMYYFLAFHSLVPSGEGLIVFDISSTLEKKLQAVAAYESQFPPSRRNVLHRIRAFAVQQGTAAGFDAGEVLAAGTALGTTDLMGLLFGH